ncbi:hypothetical protein BRADI_3g00610v3 [Brachypodium distachyon]|uniref:Pectinesterase inhibitor domain-containing protein n=2 Tax=Brachypodium distachyon TaxID=15368 RepID=A0A2K2CUG7_BRADI|nr:hypothetical protein BRADI_3g00610v3 [Brachypodium distachyon]
MGLREMAFVFFLVAAAMAPASVEAEMEECAKPVSVSAACRGAADTHHGVDYDHCVRSLSVDPRSAEAAGGGIHGLAMLATRLAIDHAASTEAKLDDLAQLEPEEEEGARKRARFNHCLEQYGGAADLLRDALDNLQAKIYGKAMEQLMAALGASESCEDAWKGEKELPVAAHDREYGRMAHIAVGFTHAAA